MNVLRRRVLLLALLVLCLFGLTILGASAATNDPSGVTAKDDGTTYVASATVTVGEASPEVYYYTDLATAIAEADDNTTVTLLNHVELSTAITIDRAGEALTLDLNEKTVSVTAAKGFVLAAGTLTIDNGTIAAEYDAIYMGTKNLVDDPRIELNLGADLTVTSDEDCCVVVYAGTLNTEANLTSYNKDANDPYTAIQGSGNPGNDGTVINVLGGMIEAKNDVAIYQPQNGTLNVSGGTITGATAVYVKAGTVNVTGGKFVATGAAKAPVASNNGCTATGDALVFETANGYEDIENVVISNTAVLESEHAASVGSYATSTDAPFALVVVNGTDYYTSLADAIAAAQNGDTVTLLSDVTLDTTITINNEDLALTLDLNGKTVNVTAALGFSLTAGTLTIDNGTIAAKYDAIYMGTKNLAVDPTIVLNLGADLTVTSNEDCCVVIYAGTLNTKADLTSNNNDPSDPYSAIQGSGNNDGTVINVLGGSITTVNDIAIYQPQNGKLNISGGVITGTTAVYVKAGTVNITGGKLVANGDKTDYTVNNNGCNATGDALVIDNYYETAPVVTITGGTFETKAKNDVLIGSYAPEGKELVTIETNLFIVLNGSKYYAPADFAKIIDAIPEGGTAEIQLLAPVKISSMITIQNKHITLVGANNVIDENAPYDLEYTASRNYVFTINNAGSLIFKNLNACSARPLIQYGSTAYTALTQKEKNILVSFVNSRFTIDTSETGFIVSNKNATSDTTKCNEIRIVLDAASSIDYTSSTRKNTGIFYFGTNSHSSVHMDIQGKINIHQSGATATELQFIYVNGPSSSNINIAEDAKIIFDLKSKNADKFVFLDSQTALKENNTLNIHANALIADGALTLGEMKFLNAKNIDTLPQIHIFAGETLVDELMSSLTITVASKAYSTIAIRAEMNGEYHYFADMELAMDLFIPVGGSGTLYFFAEHTLSSTISVGNRNITLIGIEKAGYHLNYTGTDYAFRIDNLGTLTFQDMQIKTAGTLIGYQGVAAAIPSADRNIVINFKGTTVDTTGKVTALISSMANHGDTDETAEDQIKKCNSITVNIDADSTINFTTSATGDVAVISYAHDTHDKAYTNINGTVTVKLTGDSATAYFYLVYSAAPSTTQINVTETAQINITLPQKRVSGNSALVSCANGDLTTNTLTIYEDAIVEKNALTLDNIKLYSALTSSCTFDARIIAASTANAKLFATLKAYNKNTNGTAGAFSEAAVAFGAELDGKFYYFNRFDLVFDLVADGDTITVIASTVFYYDVTISGKTITVEGLTGDETLSMLHESASAYMFSVETDVTFKNVKLESARIINIVVNEAGKTIAITLDAGAVLQAASTAFYTDVTGALIYSGSADINVIINVNTDAQMLVPSSEALNNPLVYVENAASTTLNVSGVMKNLATLAAGTDAQILVVKGENNNATLNVYTGAEIEGTSNSTYTDTKDTDEIEDDVFHGALYSGIIFFEQGNNAINIMGGTITVNGRSSLAYTGTQGTVTISGGTINSRNAEYPLFYGGCVVTLTGTDEVKPSFNVSNKLSDGKAYAYNAFDANGYKNVAKKLGFVFLIDSTMTAYTTWDQDLIGALASDDTLYLLQDITTSAQFTAATMTNRKLTITSYGTNKYTWTTDLATDGVLIYMGNNSHVVIDNVILNVGSCLMRFEEDGEQGGYIKVDFTGNAEIYALPEGDGNFICFSANRVLTMNIEEGAIIQRKGDSDKSFGYLFNLNSGFAAGSVINIKGKISDVTRYMGNETRTVLLFNVDCPNVAINIYPSANLELNVTKNAMAVDAHINATRYYVAGYTYFKGYADGTDYDVLADSYGIAFRMVETADADTNYICSLNTAIGLIADGATGTIYVCASNTFSGESVTLTNKNVTLLGLGNHLLNFLYTDYVFTINNLATLTFENLNIATTGILIRYQGVSSNMASADRDIVINFKDTTVDVTGTASSLITSVAHHGDTNETAADQIKKCDSVTVNIDADSIINFTTSTTGDVKVIRYDHNSHPYTYTNIDGQINIEVLGDSKTAMFYIVRSNNPSTTKINVTETAKIKVTLPTERVRSNNSYFTSATGGNYNSNQLYIHENAIVTDGQLTLGGIRLYSAHTLDMIFDVRITAKSTDNEALFKTLGAHSSNTVSHRTNPTKQLNNTPMAFRAEIAGQFYYFNYLHFARNCVADGATIYLIQDHTVTVTTSFNKTITLESLTGNETLTMFVFDSVKEIKDSAGKVTGYEDITVYKHMFELGDNANVTFKNIKIVADRFVVFKPTTQDATVTLTLDAGAHITNVDLAQDNDTLIYGGQANGHITLNINADASVITQSLSPVTPQYATILVNNGQSFTANIYGTIKNLTLQPADKDNLFTAKLFDIKGANTQYIINIYDGAVLEGTSDQDTWSGDYSGIIYFPSNATKANELNIMGGTITVHGCTGVAYMGPTGKVTISGNAVINNVDATRPLFYSTNAGFTVTISGTDDVKPTFNTSAVLLHSGTATAVNAFTDEGYKTIAKALGFAVLIESNGTAYTSVTNAIASMAAEDTLYLLQDITTSAQFTAATMTNRKLTITSYGTAKYKWNTSIGSTGILIYMGNNSHIVIDNVILNVGCRLMRFEDAGDQGGYMKVDFTGNAEIYALPTGDGNFIYYNANRVLTMNIEEGAIIQRKGDSKGDLGNLINLNSGFAEGSVINIKGKISDTTVYTGESTRTGYFLRVADPNVTVNIYPTAEIEFALTKTADKGALAVTRYDIAGLVYFKGFVYGTDYDAVASSYGFGIRMDDVVSPLTGYIGSLQNAIDKIATGGEGVIYLTGGLTVTGETTIYNKTVTLVGLKTDCDYHLSYVGKGFIFNIQNIGTLTFQDMNIETTAGLARYSAVASSMPSADRDIVINFVGTNVDAAGATHTYYGNTTALITASGNHGDTSTTAADKIKKCDRFTVNIDADSTINFTTYSEEDIKVFHHDHNSHGSIFVNINGILNITVLGDSEEKTFYVVRSNNPSSTNVNISETAQLNIALPAKRSTSQKSYITSCTGGSYSTNKLYIHENAIVNKERGTLRIGSVMLYQGYTTSCTFDARITAESTQFEHLIKSLVAFNSNAVSNVTTEPTILHTPMAFCVLVDGQYYYFNRLHFAVSFVPNGSTIVLVQDHLATYTTNITDKTITIEGRTGEEKLTKLPNYSYKSVFDSEGFVTGTYELSVSYSHMFELGNNANVTFKKINVEVNRFVVFKQSTAGTRVTLTLDDGAHISNVDIAQDDDVLIYSGQANGHIIININKDASVQTKSSLVEKVSYGTIAIHNGQSTTLNVWGTLKNVADIPEGKNAQIFVVKGASNNAILNVYEGAVLEGSSASTAYDGNYTGIIYYSQGVKNAINIYGGEITIHGCTGLAYLGTNAKVAISGTTTIIAPEMSDYGFFGGTYIDFSITGTLTLDAPNFTKFFHKYSSPSRMVVKDAIILGNVSENASLDFGTTPPVIQISNVTFNSEAFANMFGATACVGEPGENPLENRYDLDTAIQIALEGKVGLVTIFSNSILNTEISLDGVSFTLRAADGLESAPMVYSLAQKVFKLSNGATLAVENLGFTISASTTDRKVETAGSFITVDENAIVSESGRVTLPALVSITLTNVAVNASRSIAFYFGGNSVVDLDIFGGSYSAMGIFAIGYYAGESTSGAGDATDITVNVTLNLTVTGSNEEHVLLNKTGTGDVNEVIFINGKANPYKAATSPAALSNKDDVRITFTHVDIAATGNAIYMRNSAALTFEYTCGNMTAGTWLFGSQGSALWYANFNNVDMTGTNTSYIVRPYGAAGGGSYININGGSITATRVSASSYILNFNNDLDITFNGTTFNSATLAPVFATDSATSLAVVTKNCQFNVLGPILHPTKPAPVESDGIFVADDATALEMGLCFRANVNGKPMYFHSIAGAVLNADGGSVVYVLANSVEAASNIKIDKSLSFECVGLDEGEVFTITHTGTGYLFAITTGTKNDPVRFAVSNIGFVNASSSNTIFHVSDYAYAFIDMTDCYVNYTKGGVLTTDGHATAVVEINGGDFYVCNYPFYIAGTSGVNLVINSTTLTGSGNGNEGSFFFFSNNNGEERAVTVDLNNVSMFNLKGSAHAIYALNPSKVYMNMEDVVIETKGWCMASQGNTYWYVNLKNVDFTSTTNTVTRLYGLSGSYINIEGGRFRSNAAASTFNGNNGHAVLSFGSNITVNFYEGDVASAVAPCISGLGIGVTINVFGGTFAYTGTGNVSPVAIPGASVINVRGGTFRSSSRTAPVFSNVASESNILTIESYHAYGNANLIAQVGEGKLSASHSGYGYSSANTLTTVSGARPVLLDSSVGIGFTGMLDAASYNYLKSLASEGMLKFGMLILPTDKLPSNVEFTHYGLANSSLVFGEDYFDIEASEENIKFREDGCVTIDVAYTGIEEADYTTAYSVVFYARYNSEFFIGFDENGAPEYKISQVYAYSAYTKGENSRSLEQVSRAAYNDVADMQTDYYKHAIGNTGLYSFYTADELNRIEALCCGNTTQKELDIFLVAGGSNAAGHAVYSEQYAASYLDYICADCDYHYEYANGIPMLDANFDVIEDAYVVKPNTGFNSANFTTCPNIVETCGKTLVIEDGVCSCECGYVYNETLGLPKQGVAIGTAVADLPADLICPNATKCGASKSDFKTLLKEQLTNVFYSGLIADHSSQTYGVKTTYFTTTKYTAAGSTLALGLGWGDDAMGVEFGMAQKLSEYYNADSDKYAAIVKYAANESNLVDFLEGDDVYLGNWISTSGKSKTPAGETSGQLYKNLMKFVAEQISAYEAMGYKVNIAGLYWMQGEQDVAYTDEYIAAFNALVSDLRADLTATTGSDMSEMPIIVGEIADFLGSKTSATHTNFIKNVQHALEAKYNEANELVSGIAGVKIDATSNYAADANGIFNNPADLTATGARVVASMLTVSNTTLDDDVIANIEIPEIETPAKILDQDGNEMAGFTSLAIAAAKAPAGSTIKLFDDQALFTQVDLSNLDNVTIDGDNHTITVSSSEAALSLRNSSVTLTNFKLKNNGSGVAIKVDTASTLVIDGNSDIEATKTAIELQGSGAVLEIKSGEFKTTEKNSGGAIIRTIGAHISISGGTFEAALGTSCIHIDKNAPAKLIVNVKNGSFKVNGIAQEEVDSEGMLTGNIVNISGPAFVNESPVAILVVDPTVSVDASELMQNAGFGTIPAN